MDSPIWSATAERIRRSERFSESETAESKARGRPSQLRNDPDFSVIAATGRTTSARSVTADGAISNETTKDFLELSDDIQRFSDEWYELFDEVSYFIRSHLYYKIQDHYDTVRSEEN